MDWFGVYADYTLFTLIEKNGNHRSIASFLCHVNNYQPHGIYGTPLNITFKLHVLISFQKYPHLQARNTRAQSWLIPHHNS